METQEYIPVPVFCRQHGVEISLISSLCEFGLIEITRLDESEPGYILTSQLTDTERLIRLHDELGINLEGLDAIMHLLDRIRSMQEEIRNLKNTLLIYPSRPDQSQTNNVY